ncbi:hypothetical protein Celal_1667 [Cellulophaga algicola DSM 14237]|uniref:Uncharacterized protein n=1 Tax=Cellulophaga algicola (strain DSM 14237 / IC166 / ACAM 630) TaxID=688270 RepID=E6XBX3_CELAD|nr:hypothetical protein [Cellulophaga algicola]ADV48975.1 hypothetical protein Celal_1667 [Cellulophaga algicola DSM 14237]
MYGGKPIFDLVDNDIILKIDGATAVELDIKESDLHATWSKQHPNNPKYKHLSSSEKFNRILQSEVVIIESRRGHHELEIGVRGVKEEKVAEVTRAKHEKAAKLFNSRGFKGFFVFLEFVNFNNAVATAIDKGDVKSITNAAGSAFKISEALMELQIAVIKHSNEGKHIDIMTRNTKIVGAIGAVFTAGMCIWEANELFGKRDPDSAWAMVGASVAFTVSAGVSITGAVAAASGLLAASTVSSAVALLAWFGPLGWISALVGVGFLVLSQILTDSRLQTYFKFYLFSDYRVEGYMIGTTESPMDYNRRLYQSKSKLVDSDDENSEYYSNPQIAMALFLDLIVCNRMHLKIDGYDPRVLYTSKKEGFSQLEYRAKKIIATFSYIKFFNKKEQVKCKIFFFPNGLNSNGSNGEELDEITPHIKVIIDPEKHDAIQVTINLSTITNRIGRASKILFTTRLNINEKTGNSFPQSIEEGKERWLGALLTVYEQSTYKVPFEDDVIEFKAGTLNELKKENTW